MSQLPIPPAHDLVRLYRPTIRAYADRYRRWLLNGAGPFSNDPARHAARYAVSGEINLGILLRQCRVATHPFGFVPNAQIIRGAANHAAGRELISFPAPVWKFDFMAGKSSRICADFRMVENRRASLVWLQARRGYNAPDVQHFGMIGRLYLLKSKDTDFEACDLEIWDMREVDGDARVVHAYRVSDLHLPSESEARAMLQMFADAHALLVTEGIEKERAEHLAERRRRQRPDERQGAIF